MFTANAFVIYFTIGVPFGVLSIYLSNGRLWATKAVWFAVHLVLWPAFAAKALVTSLLPSPKPASFSNKSSIQNDLRCRFESFIPATISAVQRRNLLFEIERFAALSDAVVDAQGDAKPSELRIHTIVEHRFPLIASKCRKRKLLSQLSRHQIDAYQSIYKLIDEQGINLPNQISSELNLLIERNSATLSSDSAEDRLAA